MQLQGPRLLLRDFTPDDHEPFRRYHADPRHASLHPGRSADELLATFAGWAAARPRRHYQLAVRRLAPGRELVGCAGLRARDDVEGAADLGIELAPEFWGRHGYAIEIARILLAFGFGKLGLQAIRGVTTDVNVRVERLARWFGAELIASRPGPAWAEARGWRETEWEMVREHWRKA